MKKLLSLIIGLELVIVHWSLVISASADDFAPADEEVPVNTSNSYVLDADNTGGNVILQFGATLNESLTWDSANFISSLNKWKKCGGHYLCITDDGGNTSETSLMLVCI